MSFGVCSIDELNSKILFGENKRYIKVVSNSADLNWGGIFLATKTNITLVSISGETSKIEWSAISPTIVTVNSVENNPLETIIDTGSATSHILAMPIGSISRSQIAITN